MLRLGRICFALALAAFGIQYLLYGRFVRGLIPGQTWIPAAPLVAYALGVALLAGAVALFVPRLAAQVGLYLGILWISCTVVVNLTHLVPVVKQGTTRTGALEPLAIGAAALILSAASAGEAMRASMRARLGRALFAFTLIVFGVQHFLYAQFIAALILPWMPAHLLFVYLSGAGLVAAGLAIGAGIAARPAAIALALMFASWVVLLHVPLVATHLRDGDHWSSLFVALAMSGACWILAASPPALQTGGRATSLSRSQTGKPAG